MDWLNATTRPASEIYSSRHDSSQYSPFELMFVLPNDILSDAYEAVIACDEDEVQKQLEVRKATLERAKNILNAK